jgi:glycyl-tRNA synthetase
MSNPSQKAPAAPAENTLADIVAHAKEYGFVFPSSEIYDGLAAVYDYGPNGVELKNNLKQLWWRAMTQLNQNVVGIDAAIFMHPTTWQASGHVEGFSDPLIDNLDSKKRYRADVLIEEAVTQLRNQKEQLEKEREGRVPVDGMPWDNFAEINAIDSKINNAVHSLSLGTPEALQLSIKELKIAEPGTGSSNWTDVRQFNLMFSTQVGAVSGESSEIYLRPETAQGIFVNFLNVQKSARQKVPFGIAQIGKAFRNEIVARQFIFRMREFEQMEMQFFVRPGTEQEWYQHWKETRRRWHEALGLPADKLRFHDHEKLAHYASAAVDIEYEFPFGFKEIEGIHSRGDFDLTQHQQYSRKKQNYFDNDVNPETGKPYGNYVPYVVETSVGADRLFLATLCQAYTEETITEGEGEQQQTKTRIFLKLHPAVAPVKAAIFPLVRKDGLPEKAEEIFQALRYEFRLVLEEKDAIGKRYTRQDLIGTPFCIAVDHQTLEDDTVTVRHRDSREQTRMPIAELRSYIGEAVSLSRIFERL